MNRYLLLLASLFYFQTGIAQPDIIVQSLTGKASYFEAEGSRAKTVYPGLRLSPDGKLRCESGATVKLLRDGDIFTLKGSKLFALRELDRLPKSGSNAGFMGRFSKFLSGSMKETQNDKALEENHRRYMEKVKAGIGGFSDKPFPLQANMLTQGILGATPIVFRWSGSAHGGHYRFQLKSKWSGRAVATVHTRDSMLSLDLSQLALNEGEAYEWWLEDNQTGAEQSAKSTFVFQPAAARNVLAELRNLQDYQNAGAAEQALMEAYSLEQEELYYDAALTYETAAKMHTGNLLIRDTHAAFLLRMGLLEAAKKMIKQQ